jgi:hypothetical protein
MVSSFPLGSRRVVTPPIPQNERARLAGLAVEQGELAGDASCPEGLK